MKLMMLVIVSETVSLQNEFDNYLRNGNGEEKEFALECLSWGMCFVVVKEREMHKFFPSKYIGYKDNGREEYKGAAYYNDVIPTEKGKPYSYALHHTFDGRMSNKAINKVLGCKCGKDIVMSKKFTEYCNKLGLKGSENRKFWSEIVEEQ